MQQLLVNRFRGLFLGVAVVEAHWPDNPPSSSWQRTAESAGQVSPKAWGWWDEMAASAQALITSQSPLAITHRQQDDNAFARLIAQVFPVALFYHENLVKLEVQLSDQMLQGADPYLRDGVMSIGVAIALLCQEQATPPTLISQLLNQTFWSTQNLQNQLRQVQAFLKDHASLATVETNIWQQPSTPAKTLEVAIALAFFCWASTPDSFSLTITRGMALSVSPVLPTLIACGLSAVFNGFNGIPLNWQRPLLSSSSPSARQDILALADQLLTIWSGCYSPGTLRPPLPLEQTVVAAPGVLRPRG